MGNFIFYFGSSRLLKENTKLLPRVSCKDLSSISPSVPWGCLKSVGVSLADSIVGSLINLACDHAESFKQKEERKKKCKILPIS
jgi:hypothetical protein